MIKSSCNFCQLQGIEDLRVLDFGVFEDAILQLKYWIKVDFFKQKEKLVSLDCLGRGRSYQDEPKNA